MKKILFILIFIFPLIHADAQSSNQEVELETIVQRVDSLEHELSYLKLYYDLELLTSEIKIFSNEVYMKAVAIQSDFYNRNFDSKLATAYRQYFISCENNVKSYEELIESKKTIFAIKVLVCNYNEVELKALNASYNVLNSTFDSLKNSMKLLQVTLNAYQKYC